MLAGPTTTKSFGAKLEDLLGWLQLKSPGVQGRAVADTAPLLERDFARLAGIGWVGKNTMLIDRRLGSFTLLGALLLDIEAPRPTRRRIADTAGLARAASTHVLPTLSRHPISSTLENALVTGPSSIRAD